MIRVNILSTTNVSYIVTHAYVYLLNSTHKLDLIDETPHEISNQLMLLAYSAADALPPILVVTTITQTVNS